MVLRRAGVVLLLWCAVQTAAAQTAGSLSWQSLSAQQRTILAPLERDWQATELDKRQKWLEVAARFPAMPADERARVQQRMAEWARLTPAQRTQARMQFQEVRQLPVQERQAKWQAYQALSEEEKRSLAQRPKPSPIPASAAAPAKGKSPSGQSAVAAGSGSSAPLGRPITPIVIHARPGATTSTMTTRPPAANAAASGVPKIAATAPYVDPATMLPRKPARNAAPSPSGAASSADLPAATLR